MNERNLSPQQMFVDLVREHRPECRFAGRDRKAFQSWKRKSLPRVLATLGDPPPPASPDPELVAQWEEHGLLRQRWLINVQEHLAAVLLVNIPKGSSGGRNGRPSSAVTGTGRTARSR